MTDLATLIAFTTAIIELVKASLQAFHAFPDEAQRNAVIRWVAAFVGVAVALAFQYDALHPGAPTVAGIIVSGALLALTSDILHVGIDVGKKAATPSLPGTKVTAETTGEAGTPAASASASAAVSTPPADPPTLPRGRN